MHHRPRQLLTLATVGILASAGGRAANAQTHATLSGLVRDSAGTPVVGADVAIVALKLLVHTDDRGRFLLTKVAPGDLELSVRRLGFQPTTIQLTVASASSDSVEVVLEPQVAILSGVEVSERDMRKMLWIEDFYRRRVSGMGKYVTRDEIEARHAVRLSDAVRNVPGIVFVRTRGGNGIRFASAPTTRRDCVPQIFMDGVRMANIELDEISARDVEGVELYHGPSTTPMRFSQGALSSCGTIVIWTRVPGT
jgi:hypothetical protein